MVELLPARFQGPPKNGCNFFLFFFASSFFLFLLHLARGCAKKPIFIGFLHTLLKHLVTSCRNNEVKPKLPPKKAHHFFRKPLFWPILFSKTLILHHPPENCAQKHLPKNLFLEAQKRWPSYWPKGG